MKHPFLLLLVLIHSGCGPVPAGQTPAPVSATPEASTYIADPVLRENLEGHVRRLAETIGPRNTKNPKGYQKAAAYLEAELTRYGYQVQRQIFQVDGHACANLWASRAGGEETLVVGAHYDTCDDTPGADDNASGCAATLELARLLKDQLEGPTVRFVFFANEEPPYFQTERMGSLVFARQCRQDGENLMGMISLESVGFFSDQPNSQRFPDGVSGFPTTGNFVGFVGDLSAKPFLQRCLDGFQAARTLPAEGLTAPGAVPGVTWSDHWSFSQCGYAALMITDTAPFRNPHYHMSTDTAETLDYDRLAAVTEGARQMILKL